MAQGNYIRIAPADVAWDVVRRVNFGQIGPI